MMDAQRKRDATQVIEVFQDGIDRNNFRLKPLKPETIRRKRRLGMRKPQIPLYGKGHQERNSYINMWRIVKMKRGYRVRPRSAKHWSGRIKLKDLLTVHENGATIDTGRAVIRIPARPAWERAQQRFLKKLASQEPAAEVRAAIREVMRTGRTGRVSRFIKRVNTEAREHENRR
jgi:hypothetical protein